MPMKGLISHVLRILKPLGLCWLGFKPLFDFLSCLDFIYSMLGFAYGVHMILLHIYSQSFFRTFSNLFKVLTNSLYSFCSCIVLLGFFVFNH